MKSVYELVVLLVFCAGAGLVTYGVYWIYEPAGLIVGGLILSGAAWRYAAADPEISL